MRSQTKLSNTFIQIRLSSEQIGALRAHLFYQPYPPEQILQTLSEKSESSEILQTVLGEFDQFPQQPICQTLSGKKKTGKEYYNSLPVLFLKPIPSRHSGINSILNRQPTVTLYFANHILDPTYSLIFQVNPSREPIFIGVLLSSALAQKRR